MTVAADIEKIKVHLAANMTQVLVLAMAEIDARLKMKSPVDTGRFRASWTISVGQIDTTVAPAGGSMAVAEPRIPAISIGAVYYHANSLPYARRIEYGWSQQAPSGVVRLTAQEVPSIIEALVKQVGGS